MGDKTMARKRIAAIMAGLDREYQQDFTIGMAEETAKHDIDLCIFNCQGQAEVDVIRNDEGENAIFDLPDLNDFDGVVALCYTMVSGVALDHIKELLENISGKPTVTIDAPMDTAVEITFDDVTSVRALMEHLIHHHGYRRFGIVTGPMGNEVAMGRYHTSLEMLVENGWIMCLTAAGPVPAAARQPRACWPTPRVCRMWWFAATTTWPLA